MTTMTAEQLRIAQTKRLEVNRPADEVLELMRGLVQFDAYTAAKRKKAGCSIPLAIVAAIASFVISGLTFDAVKMAMLVLAALCAAAAIAAIVLYRRLRAQDLSDNLTLTAAPFIALLREDIRAGDPLHIDIDLRPWAIAEKKKRESAPYKKGAYYKVIDRLYVDPWFSGNAVLADGTKLRWRVVDHMLEKTGNKKNPRGKIKQKTKVKRKTVVVVTLAFPTKEYAVQDASDVERDAKRASMTLARKHKSAGEEGAALGLLVDIIADGYRRVSLTRSA
jgi:hypothetical protein